MKNLVLFAFFATLAACAVFNSSDTSAAHAAKLEGDAPLDRLMAGNRRYVAGQAMHPDATTERRGEVAKGQHPFAVIVGCADSRVPPEVVFDQGLGDLFVIRIAGNVLGDAAIGSIEYAVEHLGCELVVVVGHERCGAVDAVLKGGDLPGHMSSFTPAIRPVIDGAKKKGGDVLDNAVRANAARVAKELTECEPILSEFVHLGKLKIVGARYDLDTGEVELLDSKPPAHASGTTPGAKPTTADRGH
jgi:carbonic anhydrase